MRSPSANRLVPAPSASTTPTISWPGTTPGGAATRSPSARCRSVRQTPQAATFTRTSPGDGDRGSRVTARSGRRSMGPGESTIQARIRPAWGRGHRPDQGRSTVDGGTADLCAGRRRARRGPPRERQDPGVDHQAADRGDRLLGRRRDQVDRHAGPHCSRSRSPPAATAKTSRSEIMPDRAAHQEHADLVCGQLLGHLAQRVVLFDRDRLALHDPTDRLLGRCCIQRVAHRSSRCHRTPRELPGTRRSTGVVETSPRLIRLVHREWSVANHGCSRAARPDGAGARRPLPTGALACRYVDAAGAQMGHDSTHDPVSSRAARTGSG